MDKAVPNPVYLVSHEESLGHHHYHYYREVLNNTLVVGMINAPIEL